MAAEDTALEESVGAAAALENRSGAYTILFIALLSVGIGRSVSLTVFAPLGREIGLIEVQVGFIVTSAALFFFLGGPFWGRQSEIRGRKPIIMLGLMGYGVTTFLFAFAVEARIAGMISLGSCFVLMTLTRMLFAAVASGVYPSSQAYVATTTSAEERTSGVALMSAAFGLGSILGPALGGLLGVFSLLTPMYVAALLAIAATFLVWRRLPDAPRVRRPKGARQMRLHDRRIAPYLVMGFVFGFTMATVHQLAGFYFQDMLSLDAIGTARHVGIALVGMAIASLSAQFLIVRRYKLPPKPLLRAGIPLVVVGIAALIAAPVFEALVASLFIVGFGFGLTMPAYSAAATLSVGPYEQGRVAGLTMAAMSLGFVVGPLLGTALYQWDHHAAFFVDLVLFTALFAFTFAIRLPDPRADAAKAP